MQFTFDSKKFSKLIVIFSLIEIISFITQYTTWGLILGTPHQVILAVPALFLDFTFQWLANALFFSTDIYQIQPTGFFSWVYIFFFWLFIIGTLSVSYKKTNNEDNN
jgi:hypothetical protein